MLTLRGSPKQWVHEERCPKSVYKYGFTFAEQTMTQTYTHEHLWAHVYIICISIRVRSGSTVIRDFTDNSCTMTVVKGFFFNFFIWLGLSCSMQDLHCITRGLLFWGADSLVVHRLSGCSSSSSLAAAIYIMRSELLYLCLEVILTVFHWPDTYWIPKN